MANPYLIRVSVYPYIRKYLLYHYSEPVFVSERGFAPAFIENALELPVKVDPKKAVKKDKINYGDFIGFMVGATTARKRGMMMSSDNVKRFNEVMADLIHEEMYRYIASLKDKACQVDDSIRAFQAMYEFTEDELPFENLKRWYYRERIRLEERRQARTAPTAQFELKFFEERDTVPHKIDEKFVAQMSILSFGI